MQRRRICTCWRRLNPVISAGSSTSVGSCTPSVSTGEHPQTVRESLPDLTVNPVGRGVDQPLTNLISEGQPVWPDNHQQHATGPQPTQQDLNEIRPHRDRPRVQNTRSFPKRCRQLPVDQGCAGQAVLTPIVDEHPTHRIIPSSPPRRSVVTRPGTALAVSALGVLTRTTPSVALTGCLAVRRPSCESDLPRCTTQTARSLRSLAT